MILIDRGLSRSGRERLFSFERSCSKGSGGEGVMETPVPMPNTEVKHHSGEDSRQLRK